MKQSFVIHLAVPIWIRDRLEAFAVATPWRNKLSHSVLRLLRFFAAKKNCVYFSTVVWDRWNVSCKRMSREEAPI